MENGQARREEAPAHPAPPGSAAHVGAGVVEDGPVESAAAGWPAGVLDEEDRDRLLMGLSIEAAGIGTFDWNVSAGSLQGDGRLAALFGSPEGSIGLAVGDWLARVHPEDAERVARGVRRAVEQCKEYRLTYRVVLPDGRTRWLASRGRPLCDEARRATRFLGAAWDVTAQREETARVEAVAESLATGFMSVNGDGLIAYANAEAERVLQLPRASLIGQPLRDRCPPAVVGPGEAARRRAVETGQVVTFEVYHPEPLEAWFEVRAVPDASGLGLYFNDVSERRSRDARITAAAERTALLGRITEELVAAVDTAEAVRRLAGLVVPTLADWCIITLFDDEPTSEAGRVRAAGARHVDEADQRLVEAYARARLEALTGDALLTRALGRGESHVIDTDATGRIRAMLPPGPARELITTLGPDAALVLPLAGRSGPVGILSLFNGAERGGFTGEGLTTATHIAARAGLVLENGRLYRQQRDMAQALQRAMLTPPPELDHLQIAVRYLPAASVAQVGGDWYDAFPQHDGCTVLVIGDVVGHDIAAASAMGQVRTMLRGIAVASGKAPAEILSDLDRAMATLQVDTLTTAIVARLEQNDHDRRHGRAQLRWSSAGHPAPMMLTPDGQVTALEGDRADLLLGVDPTVLRNEGLAVLDGGATLLLYTDGLIERRDQDLDTGQAMLRQTLAALSDAHLETLCDQVISQLVPDAPGDDIALLAVRLHPRHQSGRANAGLAHVPATLPPHPAPDSAV